MNEVWSEAEKEFIRQNAGTMKDEELAATLSRVTGRAVTLDAVRHVRARMGIKKLGVGGSFRMKKS
jgi:hypothetical protein